MVRREGGGYKAAFNFKATNTGINIKWMPVTNSLHCRKIHLFLHVLLSIMTTNIGE